MFESCLRGKNSYRRSSSVRLCKGQNWKDDKMLGAPAILLGAPSNTPKVISKC